MVKLLIPVQIQLSEVDFFIRGQTTKADLEMVENRRYPPRFRVVITCTPTARHSQARIEFRGAVKDLVFDVPLIPPPPQATPTPPSVSSIGNAWAIWAYASVLIYDHLCQVLVPLPQMTHQWFKIHH